MFSKVQSNNIMLTNFNEMLIKKLKCIPIPNMLYLKRCKQLFLNENIQISFTDRYTVYRMNCNKATINQPCLNKLGINQQN